MSQYKRTLSESDVDALFTGLYERVSIPTCDNCAIAIKGDDALTFGDPQATIESLALFGIDAPDALEMFTWVFEMPVTVGGELERELRILRRRHQRECVTLCYSCVDVLQEPVGGYRTNKVTLNARAVTPPRDEPPRLFAVE